MSDQKITIETRLAIQWHLQQQLQHAEQTDFINAPAIQLLDVLETQQTTKLQGNVNSQNHKSDISRVEAKIDLLILLFTRNQVKLNSSINNYQVSLSADQIVINSSDASHIGDTIKPDQLLEIEIYFNQNCTESVIFSGQVIASENQTSVIINFKNTGKVTQSFLEKFIFRLHRTEVARLKQI